MTEITNTTNNTTENNAKLRKAFTAYDKAVQALEAAQEKLTQSLEGLYQAAHEEEALTFYHEGVCRQIRKTETRGVYITTFKENPAEARKQATARKAQAAESETMEKLINLLPADQQEKAREAFHANRQVGEPVEAVKPKRSRKNAEAESDAVSVAV